MAVRPFTQSSSQDDSLDVELMHLGDRLPVLAGPSLIASGWRGGQFVMYVTANWEFTVEKSNGTIAPGFLLMQSENYALTPPNGNGPGSPENFISHQFLSGQGGGSSNVVTLITGNSRALFKVYETIALNGAGVRAGGPITYSLNDTLAVSENGLLCNDSDANLNAAGIPAPQIVGIVSAVPAAINNNRLGVDLNIGPSR
jgi:hypothetical protein